MDPDFPQVRLYRCGDDRNWTSERLTGLDAAVEMKLLGLRLVLADLYAGLVFRPRPMLVESDDVSAPSKFAI